jgi:hypothetical protein
MSKLLTALVAAAFSLGVTGVYAADAPKAEPKKEEAKKDAGKKDAAAPKKKKESC